MKSPVLVIHGTEDEVIDFSHGIGIYERCPKAVEPLWVEVKLEYLHLFYNNSLVKETLMINALLQGAGHNDVELHSQYFDRLKKFLSVELIK